MKRKNKYIKGLAGALSTLTVLPLWTDSIDARATLPWFPVVGLVLGVGVWAVGLGVEYITGGGFSWFVALSVVLSGVVLTGGLHMDGLADTFDGLLGGSTKESRLSIMKDPAVGTFGVVAVVTVLATKLISVAYLAGAGLLWSVVPPYVVSRTSMVLLASTLKYARPEGGTGRAFVDGVRPLDGGVALLVSVILLYPLGGITAMGLLIAGMVVTVCVGWIALVRIGGVTGDVLGATSELVEVVTMVVSVVILSERQTL